VGGQTRRSGDKNALWDNAVTGAGGFSNPVEIARGAEALAIYITVNGATTVKLQAAHSGDISSEGVMPDTADTVWHDVICTNVAASYVFAGAGSVALIIPDFVPGWIRLASSNSVTATAGYETTGG
jgi:hypothetical protein